jgi:hypothetical protein
MILKRNESTFFNVVLRNKCALTFRLLFRNNFDNYITIFGRFETFSAHDSLSSVMLVLSLVQSLVLIY